MVWLTMTPTIVEALEKIQSLNVPAHERDGGTSSERADDTLRERHHERTANTKPGNVTVVGSSHSVKEDIRMRNSGAVGDSEKTKEPSLRDPKPGNPISHGQIIDLSKQLKSHNLSPFTLDGLLRGSNVYVAPLPPKPEQTSEYKALMARLRCEEEARSYDRMTNPAPPTETFSQRFPSAHAFSSEQYQEPSTEEEMTYADVNRQMALIFNVLLSIVACAGALWMVARWWSTPARLALSFSGGILVGVAEIVVYSGYIRRLAEAKGEEKKVKEVKEILKTWVIGAEEEQSTSVDVDSKEDADAIRARRRKKDIS